MPSVDHSHGQRKKILNKRAVPQCDLVLDILRKAGASGVSKLDFISGSGPCTGRRITQVSARIHELEASGFTFEHRKSGDSSFTIFVLISEPESGPADEPVQTQMRLGIPQKITSDFLQRETGAR